MVGGICKTVWPIKNYQEGRSFWVHIERCLFLTMIYLFHSFSAKEVVLLDYFACMKHLVSSVLKWENDESSSSIDDSLIWIVSNPGLIGDSAKRQGRF